MKLPADTMTTTTAAPTLTLDWAQDTKCLQPSEYWKWSWAPSPDPHTVLGGPSQTTECLPSGWGPSETYAATACPARYTSACAGEDGAVTCCPT